ncbi:MAG: hypothetical protein R3D45_04205 [Rhizobiaceae bacterium]
MSLVPGSAAHLEECVADLVPLVLRQSGRYDDARLISALIAIAVEMAAETHDNQRVAMLLHNCARILELEAGTASAFRHPPVPM